MAQERKRTSSQFHIELKLECLKEAVRVNANINDQERVINTAKAMYDFLTDYKNPLLINHEQD